jgi:predicted dehydrogenase
VKEALPAYILHGTKGSFIKSRADVQETHLKEGKQPESENWGVESEHDQGLLHFEKEGNSIRKHIPTLTGNYMEYFDLIHKAIRKDKEVPVSGEEGMMVIRVIEAAMQSEKEKKVIRLNY